MAETAWLLPQLLVELCGPVIPERIVSEANGQHLYRCKQRVSTYVRFVVDRRDLEAAKGGNPP